MSNRISNDEILSIQRKTNIVDIINEYVPLTKKGKNFSGMCPFHDDHNPSMVVSPEKQIYKCFVCGNSGNVFHFIMEYEKVSYFEAIKMVAEKNGIYLDININKSASMDESLGNMYKIYDIAYKFYQNNLNTVYGKAAKKYLTNRSITESIIKDANIGLSLNDNELYNVLSKKGFSDNEIIEAGLCYRYKNEIKDLYKNRIMFPLYDLEGRVNGFSAREYIEKTPNKYINTSETKIFKKGELLYNYHIAKPLARKEKSIIIVEGFMAVLRLNSIGIKNVVATMGTAVTKYQANLIKKMAPNIILMFDGDIPGNKATKKFLDDYLDDNDNIKIVRLEDNLDPDDYILQKGVEKMLYHISHPLSVYEYRINSLKENIDFTNSKDVSNYINMIIPEIEKIDDDIVRDLEINNISKLTNVDKDLIKSKIKEKDNKKIIINNKSNLKLSKYDKASRYIIYRMLHDPDIILYYFNNLSYLPNDIDRKLANEIVLYYKKYNSFNINDFIIYLEDKRELINLVIEIDDYDYSNSELNDDIDNYFSLIKKKIYENQIIKLTNELKKETNEIKRKEIAQKIIEIKLKESK